MPPKNIVKTHPQEKNIAQIQIRLVKDFAQHGPQGFIFHPPHVHMLDLDGQSSVVVSCLSFTSKIVSKIATQSQFFDQSVKIYKFIDYLSYYFFASTLYSTSDNKNSYFAVFFHIRYYHKILKFKLFQIFSMCMVKKQPLFKTSSNNCQVISFKKLYQHSIKRFQYE